MIQSIDKSIFILSMYAFNSTLNKDLAAAINNAVAALKTIKDGNYILYADTDSVKTAQTIDLKTLYEQTTLYCNHVDTYDTLDYHVEVYNQPNTPIFIFAFWKESKLHTISYTIREDIKL